MKISKGRVTGRIWGDAVWATALVLFSLAPLFKDSGVVYAGISRVWALGDGEKVKKDDLDHPMANSSDNPAWDGNTIRLFSGKNEFVAFQVIIEADASGSHGVNAQLNSLTNDSFVIENSGSSDPFDYVGKRIELFTQHYINIDVRTNKSFHWNKNAKPSDYYLGWVPDALIPFSATPGMGGAPFDIAANTNQGIWVDIYIPKDAAAGIYTGALEVSVDGVTTHTLPISLQVYDFMLPDECHFKNMFVASQHNIAWRHGLQAGTFSFYEMDTKYIQMAHRHRMDIAQTVRNLQDMDEFHVKYLTGELYTREYGYEGPGEDVGNTTFSVGLYNALPDEFSPNTEPGWQAGSDAWVTWFEDNAPEVEIHKYLVDEPQSSGGVDEAIMNAEWIHNNPGPGRDLMTFCTGWIVPELQGHIDFWSMTTYHYDLEKVAYEKSQGNKCGYYNGYRPCFGANDIDADAVEFRVDPWICWKYDVDQYFLWETSFWSRWNRDAQKQDHYNIFIDPSLGSTPQSRQNSHGLLFYPGEDKIFPEQDRGLAGPISSIRMKNWRRGQQDFEYLWLATQLGYKAEAETIADNCVPAALSEADLSKNISWSSRGYVFEMYRQQLAFLLAGKTGVVVGTIKDSGTGELIKEAVVTNGTTSDTTDADGRYSIKTVTGAQTITVLAAGYYEANQVVDITEGGTTTVNFQLTRDDSAPVISNVSVQKITSSEAIVTWSTDEKSNSVIKYGTESGVYTDSAGDAAYVTSHTIKLSGLSPETLYYFIITSSDQAGNSATSPERKFRTVMPPGLVGLWHFDEGEGRTAFDSSGHKNNGTLTNGTAWSDGYLGQSVSFDGIDDYVVYRHKASLGSIVNEMTFIAWVKPSQANGSIAKKWDWSNWSGFLLDADRNNLNVRIGHGDNSILEVAVSLDEYLSEFSHIAFTVSDSIVILYVNGDAKSWTGLGKPVVLKNSKDFFIGGHSEMSGDYFNGIIDEAKLYSKALTAEDIQADYLGIVGVRSASDIVINEFSLQQNYPNPFNPTTIIEYDLAERSGVKLYIYNPLGQRVKTLINQKQAPGNYSVTWNGANDMGQKVNSGLYFYRLETAGFMETKKMILMK